MTTISQNGNTLYLDNEATNGSTSFSINSTSICNVSATGLSTTFRVPLGAASNPTPSDLNQIGCTYFLTGARTNLASSSAPINLTNTDTLPIGTYILVGGGTYGPTSTTAMTLTKTGIFFDTSSGIVDSTTNGTPYFASASFITGTSIVISGGVGNGIRMATTMLINLTSPTIIYINYYAQYTGGALHNPTFKLQITRIG